MKDNSNLRDIGEIWETYCDIEQSIEVSMFVFKLNDRLDKYRRLTVSSKNYPSTLPLSTLKSLYDNVDSLVM